MHYFFAKSNQWKPFLEDEIRRDLSSAEVTSFKNLPIIKISNSISLENTYLGFAIDAMINVHFIKEDSIGSQANSLLKSFEKRAVKKVSYQVFSVSESQGIVLKGRCELLAQKVGKLFKKAGLLIGKPWDAESALLKVAIMPDRSLAYSFISVREKNTLWHLLSPFPGGYTTIKDDKLAPSRAFKKLVESQLVLNRKIQANECVLDLGACPGGWSYIALQAQAKVSAIDRTPLRKDLMSHPNLDFRTGDAFKLDNSKYFDWVISDIICAPERILELIDNWVVSESCKNFVFTLKFKGSEDYPILSKFKEKLSTLNYDSILRQLNVNKNEVMVLGKIKEEVS